MVVLPFGGKGNRPERSARMEISPSMKKAAALSAAFTLVLATIMGLLFAGLITFPVALLMMIGLIGICIAVAIMVAAWRLTGNID